MGPLFGPVPGVGPVEIILLVVSACVPLAILGLVGKVVYDRLRGSGSRAVPDAEDAPVSDRWWWLVAAQPVWFVLFFAVAIGTSVTNAYFLADAVYWMVLFGLALLPLAPIGVHFDRKYVAAAADWRPSIAYYLTFASFVGVLLAAMYLYERHERVGVP